MLFWFCFCFGLRRVLFHSFFPFSFFSQTIIYLLSIFVSNFTHSHCTFITLSTFFFRIICFYLQIHPSIPFFLSLARSLAISLSVDKLRYCNNFPLFFPYFLYKFYISRINFCYTQKKLYSLTAGDRKFLYSQFLHFDLSHHDGGHKKEHVQQRHFC